MNKEREREKEKRRGDGEEGREGESVGNSCHLVFLNILSLAKVLLLSSRDFLPSPLTFSLGKSSLSLSAAAAIPQLISIYANYPRFNLGATAAMKGGQRDQLCLKRGKGKLFSRLEIEVSQPFELNDLRSTKERRRSHLGEISSKVRELG